MDLGQFRTHVYYTHATLLLRV